MNVIHICKTSSELTNIIKKNKIVVLKLSANWCEPCKLIAPIFTKVANNVNYNINKLPENIPRPSIKFLSIDIDNICEDKGVKWGSFLNCSGVPMFIFFFNGKTHETIIGADMNAFNDMIEDLIQKALP
tara:strand:+ start:520 stop:906 length:387 start_codon:yes stop_codon:yes gene_type:complete